MAEANLPPEAEEEKHSIWQQNDCEESAGNRVKASFSSGWGAFAMLSQALRPKLTTTTSSPPSDPVSPEPAHYQSRDYEKTPPSPHHTDDSTTDSTPQRMEPPSPQSSPSTFHALMANATDAWILSQTSSVSPALSHEEQSLSEHDPKSIMVSEEQRSRKGRRKLSRPVRFVREPATTGKGDSMEEPGIKEENEEEAEQDDIANDLPLQLEKQAANDTHDANMDFSVADDGNESIDSMSVQDKEEEVVKDESDEEEDPTISEGSYLRIPIYPTLSAESNDSMDSTAGQMYMPSSPKTARSTTILSAGRHDTKISPPVSTDSDPSSSSHHPLHNLEGVFVHDKHYAWIPAKVLERKDDSAIVAVDLPDSWADSTALEDEIPLQPTGTHPSLNRVPIEEQKRLISKYRVTATQLRKVMYSDYENLQLPLQNDGEGKRDMADLVELHFPAIMYNVKTRHYHQKPYTRVGDIIIAMNPFSWINELYEPRTRDLYSRKLIWEAQEDNEYEASGLTEKKSMYDRLGFEPHVYEASSLAYHGLATTRQDQTILVTGESGAGKTETVKIVMDHLATVQQTRPEGLSSDHATAKDIVARVLQSSPAFEAFGNAKTVRNYNSSRFGKLTKLQFRVEPQGMAESAGRQVPYADLVGSNCTTYLLEKNRVVSHDEGERTFHIFYQLLTAEQEFKEAIWPGLAARSAQDFIYTAGDIGSNQHDIAAWEETLTALKTFRYHDDSLKVLLRALVIVLQLGNIIFEQDPEGDHARVREDASLTELADMMGLEEAYMQDTLTSRALKTPGGHDNITVKLSQQHAKQSCDALAKEIYSKIFEALVQKINSYTDYPESLLDARMKCCHISLLDIFGFERFGTNRFEQLCINYANERLHNKYVLDNFNEVKEEYETEGIDLYDFKLVDNSAILSLLEGSQGVIAALDEECVRPKGNDEAFVYKIKGMHLNTGQLIDSKLHRKWEFGIAHFNGPVEYDAQNVVSRNTDKLPKDLIECAAKSQNTLIRDAFQHLLAEESSESPAAKKSTTGTVLKKFQMQLKGLMSAMEGTKTRYIRCIKPNAKMIPRMTNHNSTIEQLQCSGIMTALTISRESFPNKLPYEFVWRRYACLLKRNELENALALPVKKRVEQLLLTWLRPRSQNFNAGSCVIPFAFGKTKVFFKSGAQDTLEQARRSHYELAALRIQSTFRRISASAVVVRMMEAAVTIQSFGRMSLVRLHVSRLNAASTRLASWFRGRLALWFVKELRKDRAATLIQVYARGYAGRENMKRSIKSINVIQRSVRQWIYREQFLSGLKALVRQIRAKRRSATVIQAFGRGFNARRNFKVQQDALFIVQGSIRHWQSCNRLRAALKVLASQARSRLEYTSATTLQSFARAVAARHLYRTKRASLLILQRSIRQWREFVWFRKSLQAMVAHARWECKKDTSAATIIQAMARRRRNQRRFVESRQAIRVLQRSARQLLVSKKFRSEMVVLKQARGENHETVPDCEEKKETEVARSTQLPSNVLADFEEMYRYLREEIQILRSENRDLKSEVETSKAKEQNLRKKMSHSEDTITLYESRVQGLVKANNALVAQLDSVRKDSSRAAKQSKKDRAEYESKIATMEKERMNTEAAHRNELQDLQKAVQDSRAQNVEIQRRWEQEISARKEKRDDHKKKLNEEMSAAHKSQQKQLTQLIEVLERGQAKRQEEISKLTEELTAVRRDKDKQIGRLQREVKALRVQRSEQRSCKEIRAALEPRSMKRQFESDVESQSQRSEEFEYICQKLYTLISETCVMPRYVSEREMKRVIEQQERGESMSKELNALMELYYQQDNIQRDQSNAAYELVEEYIGRTEPNRTISDLRDQLSRATVEANRLQEELHDKTTICKRCAIREEAVYRRRHQQQQQQQQQQYQSHNQQHYYQAGYQY